VGLHVLLEILWTLERFATEVALVRLQRHMNSDVRGNVVTLDGGCATCTPLTGQVEVVGALATDVALAYVILDDLLVSGVYCDEERVRHARETSDAMRRGSFASKTTCRKMTYVESFGTLASLTTALPLAGEVVNC
jgi:hypothetical protein